MQKRIYITILFGVICTHNCFFYSSCITPITSATPCIWLLCNSNGSCCSFVDWITLSVALLFSMRYATNYAEFEKGTLYNKVPMFDYVTD